MTIRRKSQAMRFLENLTGGALSFGELIRSIRLGEEEPQASFAKRLDISVAHLCDIEKGRKTVSVERAARFAKVLGYSKEQFVRLALQEIVNKARLDMHIYVEAA